ncbi:MAG: TerC/Alx family metal homeostasis membrane protein [Longimicrobiales bacterium]|nr:TerC/Alx family metal homeostasis membrane protein [Longimicrobiales bacterium]
MQRRGPCRVAADPSTRPWRPAIDIVVWTGFVVFILVLLALDLGVFHRENRAQSFFEALAWSGFWIALALAFIGVVYLLYENNWVGGGLAFPEDVDGRTAALEFFAGYVLEKSLSLDNIFVIALIFAHLRIPLEYQHRILFWGVCGALIMRGLMIGLGAELIHRFFWTSYIFGGILLLTAVRLMVAHHDNLDPSQNVFVRGLRRFMPITDDIPGEHFTVVRDGTRYATPLLVALLMVESADLLFAVDSVPAIFAITSDPFLVYSSNVFAVLGLRSLYFALAPLLEHFRFLRPSLVLILAFVGIKMLILHHVEIPVTASLIVIGGVLAAGIVASVVVPPPGWEPLRSPVESERERLMRITLETARRSVVLVVGGTLILIGAALKVLPGVGVWIITAGVSILGTQFVWARRLLRTRARE